MNFRSAEGAAAVPGTGGSRTKALVVVLILVALGAAAVIAAYAFSSPPPPTTAGEPSFMHAACGTIPMGNNTVVEHDVSGGSGSHAYFLIVESDPSSPYAGINGSYYVPPTTQWPIMRVKVGQVVSIHVINCASSEPHGFQISYYDDIQQNGRLNLITIPAGQSYNVTFTATKAGTFRVYCGIECSIHPLMQNGALVVS